MKWPEELRNTFSQRMKNDGIVTQEDVIEMVRPYIVFDPENALQRLLVRMADSFIASYKSENEDGYLVRDIFSFMMDGQKGWADVTSADNVDVLQAQRKQLISKWVGLRKSIKKIDDKIASLGGEKTEQGRLFDVEMEKVAGMAALDSVLNNNSRLVNQQTSTES